MASTKYRRILRTPREIAKMRRAGLVVWEAHQAVARLMQPGVTTAELNQAVRKTFANHRAESLFLNYGGPPPFPAETCISINEELVHGIPGARKVKAGDIVKIDTGCRVDGWCGDAAFTHAVGPITPVAQRLLDATLGALNLAIDLMKTKQRWSQVAREMQAFVEGNGFHVVDTMVGHGIGQNLHEPPQVPNLYDSEWAAREDFELRPGIVIAVEPMVNVGTPRLREMPDRWTQVSADRSLTAHFEHTIALTADGPRRLTGPPVEDEIQSLPDWLQDPSKWLIW
ncbi:MAG: type I methionyl aminopeptidase [Pirellulaceae bacterium]|nr:type I methionyl aminopeptidase [Pirellulaceae bacterium]